MSAFCVGLDLIVLRDERSIAEEGRLMAHCMELTPSLFLDDGQQHFSVRRQVSGRRVGSCSVRNGYKRPVLTEVLGLANKPSSKSVRRVAELLARHLNLAKWHNPRQGV